MQITMSGRYILACLTFVWITFSCTEETSEQFESDSFVRIYDNNTFSESYSPIDMLQTSDGGYVILATKEIPDVQTSGVYLIKADTQGKFVSSLTLEDTYTNPLAGMIIKDEKIWFACMSTDSQAKLISVDHSLGSQSVVNVPLSYPSAVAFYDSEILMLSYDQVEKNTVFSRLGYTSGAPVSRSFKVADDDSMEDDILKHFLRRGVRYPFQIGRLSSGFFFNGFYDYTFSLVFTNLGDDDDVDGVVQGQQENGGFSAILNTDGSNFAVSYFNFGTNYILPKTTLSQNTLSSISELNGFNIREFVPDAAVQIVSASVNGKNVLVYASNTRSKQIGLLFYDAADGALLGSKHLGFSNAYELGRVIVTDDGGLAVAGTAYIAGRFPRACLMKISKDEFSEVIHQ
jgi:hypothetical protein